MYSRHKILDYATCAYLTTVCSKNEHSLWYLFQLQKDSFYVVKTVKTKSLSENVSIFLFQSKNEMKKHHFRVCIIDLEISCSPVLRQTIFVISNNDNEFLANQFSMCSFIIRGGDRFLLLKTGYFGTERSAVQQKWLYWYKMFNQSTGTQFVPI